MLLRKVNQAFTNALIVTCCWLLLRLLLLDWLLVPVLAHRTVDGFQVRQLMRRHATVIDLFKACRLLEHCGLLGSRALNDSLWILVHLIYRLPAELRHGHLLWRQAVALHSWTALARLRRRRIHIVLSDTTAFNPKLVLLNRGR